LAKIKLKLGKKNRNTISGLLVGLASIFAVSTYMKIPGEELQGFLVATLLFFCMILLLAILGIIVIKLLTNLKNKISNKANEPDQVNDKE